MIERPKEEDGIMKEIKRKNIRLKNKGWRYKEELKRKKYKSKEEKDIMKIYQQQIKYLDEKKTTIRKSTKIGRNNGKDEKERKTQNEEVRAWRNPHKLFALAMLRNFILLLRRNIPEEEKGKEIGGRGDGLSNPVSGIAQV